MIKAIGIAALGLAATVGILLVLTSHARAHDYRIIFRQEVPSVLGIREAPYPMEYNRAGPRIMSRPSAGIGHLYDEAPANGCEDRGGGFRIESGAGRGRCFGGVAPLR